MAARTHTSNPDGHFQPETLEVRCPFLYSQKGKAQTQVLGRILQEELPAHLKSVSPAGNTFLDHLCTISLWFL